MSKATLLHFSFNLYGSLSTIANASYSIYLSSLAQLTRRRALPSSALIIGQCNVFLIQGSYIHSPNTLLRVSLLYYNLGLDLCVENSWLSPLACCCDIFPIDRSNPCCCQVLLSTPCLNALMMTVNSKGCPLKMGPLLANETMIIGHIFHWHK